MKKYKMFYGIVMVINIILVITRGFSANKIIYSYNDRVRDGFQGSISLSTINCFMIAVIIISAIAVTLNKKNKMNKKWLFCAVTIITALCIPIGIHSYSGGIMGIKDEDNIYLWNIVHYLTRYLSKRYIPKRYLPRKKIG